MCQVLYRDDGAPLGCVLRPPQRRRSHLRLHDHGRIAAPGRVLERRRSQACRAVERAGGTEEGAPGAADSGGRTPFRPVPTRPCSPTA
jgi:hypothetical protein